MLSKHKCDIYFSVVRNKRDMCKKINLTNLSKFLIKFLELFAYKQ